MTTSTMTARPCAGDCGKRIRPHHTHRDDYPGTVAEKARGLCTTCHRNTDTVRQPAPEFCQGCRAVFRPHGTPAHARPGTVHHAGRGYCSACYYVAAETGALDVDAAEIRAFDVEKARTALGAWITERRRRRGEA